MTLESSKNMGGIGALLIVIGALPFLGAYTSIIALIGFILVLIALNGLANYYSDRGIFNNALYGILTAIVGGVITFAIVFTVALSFLESIGISLATLSDPAAVSQIDWASLVTLEDVLPFIGGLLVAVVVLFVFVVVSAFFVRRSFNLASSKTGVGMFGTAGLLLLIGAVLTIIVIGFLLMWIAAILLIVAFFRIRAQPAAVTSPPPTPPQQT